MAASMATVLVAATMALALMVAAMTLAPSLAMARMTAYLGTIFFPQINHRS